jgi:hypothetical protein
MARSVLKLRRHFTRDAEEEPEIAHIVATLLVVVARGRRACGGSQSAAIPERLQGPNHETMEPVGIGRGGKSTRGTG